MQGAVEILAGLVNDPGLGIEDEMLQISMQQVIQTVAAALGLEVEQVAGAIERHWETEAMLMDAEMEKFEQEFGDALEWDAWEDDSELDELTTAGFEVSDRIASDAAIDNLYGVPLR